MCSFLNSIYYAPCITHISSSARGEQNYMTLKGINSKSGGLLPGQTVLQPDLRATEFQWQTLKGKSLPALFAFTWATQHSQKHWQLNHVPVHAVTLLWGLYTTVVKRKYISPMCLQCAVATSATSKLGIMCFNLYVVK